MIEIKAKIHDKFSIEFKVGFIANNDVKDNYFAINTWIFVPNSLDINPETYGKDQFYRDVKSNVRLITPVFRLDGIVSENAVPVSRLRSALENLAANPSQENIATYEYNIKMFSAVVKSALRDESERICSMTDGGASFSRQAKFYVRHARNILTTYRSMASQTDVPEVEPSLRNYYSFGDEFMSQLAEHYAYRILDRIRRFPDGDIPDEAADDVRSLIREIVAHKEEAGFEVISPNDPVSNRNVVYRHSILKKYVESDLYIKLHKKRDGHTMRELYYSLAAGIAMIFATIVAFSFQKRFGNFSMPLFVALVISYMLKDRIKEVMRYFFAHKLGKRYFDNKAIINIKEQEVGWLKEGVDFITDQKTPEEVLEIRNRSSLLEAENRIFDEKIILYRKLAYIDTEKLAFHNDYPLSGINDILRLHINRFTLKMDDPQVPLRKLNDDGTVEIVYTDKIYYINIVMQFVFGEQQEYKRFRVIASRSGILEIQEMM